MANADTVRLAISKKFAGVEDLGNGILRGERRYLELIANGEAFVAEATSIATAAPALDDPLGTGFLRTFCVGQFRPSISGRLFSFGDVNLIFGQNGAGKP